MIPRILVFAGSNRIGAYSGRTADVAQKTLALQGAEVTRISLADYPLPIMDEDLEREKGIPENAFRLARLIAAHDGVLVATPEYNRSLPPLLKNTIDWVSRVSKDNGRPLHPFRGRAFAVCSSSSGPFAGIYAINHLRTTLVHVGCEVVAPQCSVAHGAEAFDENGEFANERSRSIMDNVCATLIERAKMLSTRVGQ